MNEKYAWWQKGIIYQIYPRSFQDSNGDGIGDLPGIIQRLDYVKSLGVDAIWLSPIYPSPMHDFGYDVADYCDIHPMFGTLADFDRLLEETHRRGLKLLLDLVPNHTSDEHPWFVESRSSRDNPKRDWYIWRDPVPDGGPPNNWLSFFGGPAWSFDKETGQYYMHQFDTHQPELNYRHPDVLPAMLNNMRFWLDKGIDGFRVDVIWLMMKDAQFRNEPPNPDWESLPPPMRNPSMKQLRIYTKNLPEVHDLIKKFRTVIDDYDERVLIGEIYEPFDQLVTYYGDNDECHLPFNFHLIMAPTWEASVIRKIVDEYEALLPPNGWPNWVLGNHDQHRIASRAGAAQARVAQMLLLTLRGTPTCYYGDEIGMENVEIPLEFIKDPPAVNQPELADEVGRDPERTPMQWDNSPNAGFTEPGVQPWLPLADDYAERNVANQDQEPTSMLNLYRALTALRQAEPALNVGHYAPLETEVDDQILAYTRTAPDGSSRFLVLLNFSENAHLLNLEAVGGQATVVLSTGMTRSGPVDLARLQIAANEGLILHLA